MSCIYQYHVPQVFEFMERTILEDLEARPDGLPEDRVRNFMCQLVRAVEFCHAHNVVHRDIKPENLLIGAHDELRLCDFGFARPLGSPGARYSDYVATRWYRAPELLVGDTQYGKGVDVWALGCILVEVQTGVPAFPGQDDLDQLWLIMKALGSLCDKHVRMVEFRSSLNKVRIPRSDEVMPLRHRFPQLGAHALSFLEECFRPDPDQRRQASDLLKLPYFEPLLSSDRGAPPGSSSSQSAAVHSASNAPPHRERYQQQQGHAYAQRPSSSISTTSNSVSHNQHQQQQLQQMHHHHHQQQQQHVKPKKAKRKSQPVGSRHGLASEEGAGVQASVTSGVAAAAGPTGGGESPNEQLPGTQQRQPQHHDDAVSTTLPFLQRQESKHQRNRSVAEHEKPSSQGSRGSVPTPHLPSVKPHAHGSHHHENRSMLHERSNSDVQVLQVDGEKEASTSTAGSGASHVAPGAMSGTNSMPQSQRASKAQNGPEWTGNEGFESLPRTPSLEPTRPSKSRGAEGSKVATQPIRQATQELPQPGERRQRKHQQPQHHGGRQHKRH